MKGLLSPCNFGDHLGRPHRSPRLPSAVGRCRPLADLQQPASGFDARLPDGDFFFLKEGKELCETEYSFFHEAYQNESISYQSKFLNFTLGQT